nr:class I SAM-dependent methyltransferase [uncultured Selenomonas sp.]
MDSLEPLRRENYRDIMDCLKRHLPQEGEVRGLDIGCARGWFLQAASAYGVKMDGIEPEQQFFEMAKPYGDYVANGLFPQDFCPPEDHGVSRKYDFIIFNDVLEHIPDIENTIQNCRELLKPQGFLIVNCPDNAGTLFHVAKMMQVFGLDASWRRLWQCDFYSPHLWYFGKKSLDLMMQHKQFTFIDKISLTTMMKAGLYDRIMVSASNKVSGFVTYILLRLGMPVLNILPGDILCRVYRREDIAE